MTENTVKRDTDSIKEERRRRIRRGQKQAVALHILLILAYMVTGILLWKWKNHCRLDAPIYLIYTIEIIVCSILLATAERKLWRKNTTKDRKEEGAHE